MRITFKNNLLAVGILALALLPSFSEAATVMIGDKISVKEGEVIENDYYVSVGTLGTTVMSGTVNGDMYALAGSVTANGTINGDFGSFGGLSNMHASVTDDVRIISGDTVIDNYVGGDVLVIGGMLKILSTAKIDGDVIFYGYDAEISGEVGGSVYGSANNLRIDNKVGGGVDVNIGHELKLGDNADIAGDVRYRGFNKLVRAQDSVIGGEIQKQDIAPQTQETVWRSILIPLFVSLFATLTLYLLFKKEMQLIVKTIFASPLPAGLIGLATLIAGPLVSLVLVSTVLGMLLGIFGIGAILLLTSIGVSLAIALIGAVLAKSATGQTTVSLWWLLLGAMTFHALLYLPYFGLLIIFTLLSVAIGGVLLTLYRTSR